MYEPGEQVLLTFEAFFDTILQDDLIIANLMKIGNLAKLNAMTKRTVIMTFSKAQF